MKTVVHGLRNVVKPEHQGWLLPAIERAVVAFTNIQKEATFLLLLHFTLALAVRTPVPSFQPRSPIVCCTYA